MNEPIVCSIGCTDPWNAAGLGLDIRALAECGAYPVTVVAGITAQNRAGVSAASPTPPDLLAAQFASLAEAGIAAYRIGALLDIPTVTLVAEYLAGTRVPAVYDPVFAPSGGGSFAGAAVCDAIRERLVPIVAVVTPNLGEAALLAGREVSDVREMESAGRDFVARGAGAALIKGGHLRDSLADVLVDDAGTVVYEDRRLGAGLRGTGCLLAASLAVSLARGEPLRDAVATARTFVRTKIAHPQTRGGMSLAY